MKKYGFIVVFALLGLVNLILAIISVLNYDWCGYCMEMSQVILNLNMIIFVLMKKHYVEVRYESQSDVHRN